MEKRIEDMTTEEIFQELKQSVSKVSFEDLSDYQNNLLIALNSALKTDQKKLLEKCLFFHECIKKENKLIAEGFDKFIYKDDLDYITTHLSRKNDKNIFFIELEEYPRIIPKDIVEKIQYLKGLDGGMFDQYYVLYTDYTKKANRIANEGNVAQGKKVVEKDPILFGAFVRTNVQNNVNYMGERIYFIADWVDEYCDLTLDRLLSEVPNKVHSLFGDKQIKDSELKKLKEIPFAKTLYNDIVKEIDKRESKIERFFNTLKRMFK